MKRLSSAGTLIFSVMLLIWNFNDGYGVTTTRSFVLSGSEIAAANAAGSFQVNLDGSALQDFIAFDWFELSGNSTAVPESAALLLLGLSITGLAPFRKRFRND